MVSIALPATIGVVIGYILCLRADSMMDDEYFVPSPKIRLHRMQTYLYLLIGFCLIIGSAWWCVLQLGFHRPILPH